MTRQSDAVSPDTQTSHQRTPDAVVFGKKLPRFPDIDHLKQQAKQLFKLRATTEPSAKLTDAQFALAREYGFTSWRALRSFVLAAAADRDRPRLGIEMPETELDRYVGHYLTQCNQLYSITRDGHRLFSRQDGQPAIEMNTEGDDSFFSADRSECLSFVTDDTGGATALIDHRIGIDRMASRIDAKAADAVKSDPHCSFCRKSAKDVKTLIVGPYVSICDECVGLCSDIVAARGVNRTEGTQHALPARGERFDRRHRAPSGRAIVRTPQTRLA